MRSNLKKTVLIVEDNDPLRDNILEILQLEGFEAEGASNGKEAQSRLTKDPIPDLVILDWVMPELDGRTLAEAIKLDPRLSKVRIVLTTGHSTIPPELANYTVLQKPFGVAELLRVLSPIHG